ncbi:MAG: preprotein translocase subunit Sec61beta [Candidatus Bathyarchaeia archaeon]
MSRRRRKKEGSPGPAQGAGLLRFFEEETEGIKVKPEILLALTIALIVICILGLTLFSP